MVGEEGGKGGWGGEGGRGEGEGRGGGGEGEGRRWREVPNKLLSAPAKSMSP